MNTFQHREGEGQESLQVLLCFFHFHAQLHKQEGGKSTRDFHSTTSPTISMLAPPPPKFQLPPTACMATPPPLHSYTHPHPQASEPPHLHFLHDALHVLRGTVPVEEIGHGDPGTPAIWRKPNITPPLPQSPITCSRKGKWVAEPNRKCGGGESGRLERQRCSTPSLASSLLPSPLAFWNPFSGKGQGNWD